MKNITIEVTDAEYMALQYAALSPEDWVDNLATDRARIAIDEIIKITVDYCLDNNIVIPASRDEIVLFAFNNGVVATAAERTAAFNSEEEV